MKKAFLLFAAISVFNWVTNAQNTRFGFTVGGTMANYKISASGLSISGDDKFGLTFGTVVDIPMSEKFSIQPGLHFVQKGLIIKDASDPSVTIKDITTISMIELPINFLYNSGGSNGNFFVGAGPSIAFGVSGKGKTTFSDGTPSETIDLKFGNTDQDDLKGLDLGANLIAGYRLSSGLMFSFNYNLGLSNVVPKPADGESMKSHYFGLRLGWMLGGSSKDKK